MTKSRRMNRLSFLKGFEISLQQDSGRFPVAWCKEFGQGRVFYTSLGHNETVWENKRYQKHILGGIKWTLGLEKGDATPQATAQH